MGLSCEEIERRFHRYVKAASERPPICRSVPLGPWPESAVTSAHLDSPTPYAARRPAGRGRCLRFKAGRLCGGSGRAMDPPKPSTPMVGRWHGGGLRALFLTHFHRRPGAGAPTRGRTTHRPPVPSTDRRCYGCTGSAAGWEPWMSPRRVVGCEAAKGRPLVPPRRGGLLLKLRFIRYKLAV